MVGMQLKQIWNRRRSNLGIFIELLLVFILIWYIVDFLFVLGYTYRIPSYRNVDHTFKLIFDCYPETAPEYREKDEEERRANFLRLYNQLSAYPGVTAITYSEDDFYPGSGSMHTSTYISREDSTRTISPLMLDLFPVGDYFTVFGFTTSEGKERVSIEAFDWNDPNKVVITGMVARKLFPGQHAIGKSMIGPKEKEYIVQGVVDDIKRYNNRRPSPYIFRPVVMNYDFSREKLFAFAVRTDSRINEAKFMQEFSGYLQNNLNVGNYYLKRIVPFNEIFKDREYKSLLDLRIRMGLMFFFLLSISLCLIGTFWYRINKRRSEIGLKISFGATKEGIRRAFIAEGLLLLTFAAVLAVLIELNIVNAELISTFGQEQVADNEYLPDKTWIRFLLTNLITWVIMAVITTLSVWFPAQAASRINPVDALRDE